jgi:hypothetical protein
MQDHLDEPVKICAGGIFSLLNIIIKHILLKMKDIIKFLFIASGTGIKGVRDAYHRIICVLSGACLSYKEDQFPVSGFSPEKCEKPYLALICLKAL